MTEINFESQGEQNISGFLNEAFRGQNFRVFQLAGDASARRYFRVAAGGQTYVLMVWEPFTDDGKYPFLNILSHWQSQGIPVPQVIKYSSELGLVLLEDLGDLTLERRFWEVQSEEIGLSHYYQTLDLLAKIHFPERHEHYVAHDIEFDSKKFMWEFNYAKEHFLKSLCQISFSDNEEKELDSIFQSICDTLDQQPKVICHRDLHSRNLMIKLDSVYFIDFQDARLGPIQYDLVSLLKDSYVDISNKGQSQLLKYYYEKYVSKNTDISSSDFYKVYDIQTLQRCFKACGSFASFYVLREDTRYLKYLSKTIATVRECLMKFPEYSYFLEVIDKHGLCQKNFDAS